jgi:hypothetical protein
MLNKINLYMFYLSICICISDAMAYVAPQVYHNGPGFVDRLIEFESSFNDFLNVVFFISGIGVFFGAMSQYGKYRSNPESTRLGTVMASFAAALALFGLAFIPMP